MTTPLVVVTPEQLAEIVRAAVRAEIQPRAEWLTIADAAAQSGVSEDTIRRKVRAGEIEAKGSGKLRRVRL